jgi:hypothetical protein
MSGHVTNAAHVYKRMVIPIVVCSLLFANLSTLHARTLRVIPLPCAGGDCMLTANQTLYSNECGGYATVTLDCNCNITVLLTGVDPRQSIQPILPSNFDSLVAAGNLLSPGILTGAYLTNPETSQVFYFSVATSQEKAEILYKLSIDPELECHLD